MGGTDVPVGIGSSIVEIRAERTNQQTIVAVTTHESALLYPMIYSI